MKTNPMEHQLEARRRLQANRALYALACEQGTGKTWMILDNAEYQFEQGFITALLVIAPKGVHTNWIKREAPTHLSIDWTGAAYSSGMGAYDLKKVSDLNVIRGKLVILTMNIDAVNTKKGFLVAFKFMKSHKVMMVIDESQRIKNPDAKRTEKVIQLGAAAHSRRIASGTMVTQGPMDLFSQFQFLRNGLLGTTSYRTFVTQYAEVLPNDHPLVIAATKRARWAPQIVERDFMGRPKYKNLDALNRKIQPYCYRVKKEDCLDLPEKIYKIIEFTISPEHRRAYNKVRDDLRYEYGDGEIDIFNQMTVINKLRQAASGFIMADGEKFYLENGDSRLQALLDLTNDLEGPTIVWASYVEEIRAVTEALEAIGKRVVTYYGATSQKDRDAAIDAFQAGEIDYFVANPAAGGTGITLTAAENVVYYSNSPSLEHRIQSEDRCHRIGLRHPVLYIDLTALDTVDERLSAALQRKEFVAKEIIDGAF